MSFAEFFFAAKKRITDRNSQLAGDTRGSSITNGCSVKTKLTSDVLLFPNWSGENKLRARAVGSSLKAILMTVVPGGTYLTDNPPYSEIFGQPNFLINQEGYSFNIPQIDPNTRQPLSSKVSSMDFYGYFIMVRRNSPNVIVQFGQLFHQFLVDMYAKVESERLRYITLLQRNLRAESYIHLRNALSTDANINPNSLGQRIILPSSFVNSPRTCIKFCVKNEIKCANAFRMLTVAYGEATLDRSKVYRWYKMFSEGRVDVNDEERAGRPRTSTTDEIINEVEKMILANRRITVREVAEDLNISIGSCHSIFINDLGMRRIAAIFVPKLLNCDQKQHRMNIANEMLDSVRDDPNLFQRVITGDEAWVYGYDVETKAQSSQWKLPHEPRPKKARQVRSNVKDLLTVFFDCRGVVHHEFLPQGGTANKAYYLQVMRNLPEAIRQKRPDLWKNKNWLLHHDNAPAHTSLLVRYFLAKNNTLMMPTLN
ncbi:hypothetical protein LAZ67_23000892 [Cordylochernes scorpioides]|uniref:Helitron helicase-like domain-containing protein n=1 Tax=Cordylochernes scorpioides TaxID=51811 RepID=A0ABY6LV29_9ARAC|nr:hypothetical protein LAZ67_23000892 [Cordylochernes scorpioides]